jgi:aspartyl-tRNA(Asn)/glutamyl-tRNA(Gln) amidotransferase subunit A
LKPSVGQIARYGGFAEILSDFEVVGPIARTAKDLRSVFSILKGYDPAEPSSLASLAEGPALPARCRIAYLPQMGSAPVDPVIARAANEFAAALTAAGHAIEVIETPYDAESVGRAWGTIAAAGLNWHLKTIGSREGLGSNALSLDEAGAAYTASDYAAAMATAHAARQDAGRFFERYDLLLCPSIAALAWPAADPYPPEIDSQPVGPRGHAVFTGWMNVTGVCAVNVPVAMTSNRGGIGLQLVGPIGRDTALLDFVCNLPAIGASGPAPLSRRFD